MFKLQNKKQFLIKKFKFKKIQFRLLNLKLLLINFYFDWKLIFNNLYYYSQFNFIQFEHKSFKLNLIVNEQQIKLNKFNLQLNNFNYVYIYFILETSFDIKFICNYLKNPLLLINYKFYFFSHYILFSNFKYYENYWWNLYLINNLLLS